MAKREPKPTPKPKSPPPSGSAGQRADDPGAKLDRTVAALFQVPKSAVDDAEAARPKRTRRKKGG
jgi:hypothetical protein